MAFDFDQRVIVVPTPRTRELGAVGWHGVVVGRSYENDDPDSGAVVAYGVAVDEKDGLGWFFLPEDLLPDPAQ